MTSRTLNVSLSGAGASYTNISGTTDAYNATCMSSDGNMNITGGSVTCTCASGASGGKGITSNGTLIIGDLNNIPTLSITTAGSKIAGATTGGGGPDGSTATALSAPKAIKSDAAITINNGLITIASNDDGIKSEVSTTINNGIVNISGGFLIGSGSNSGNMIQATSSTSTQYAVKITGTLSASTLIDI